MCPQVPRGARGARGATFRLTRRPEPTKQTAADPGWVRFSFALLWLPALSGSLSAGSRSHPDGLAEEGVFDPVDSERRNTP